VNGATFHHLLIMGMDVYQYKKLVIKNLVKPTPCIVTHHLFMPMNKVQKHLSPNGLKSPTLMVLLPTNSLMHMTHDSTFVEMKCEFSRNK
jgi:hypothetical protein